MWKDSLAMVIHPRTTSFLTVAAFALGMIASILSAQVSSFRPGQPWPDTDGEHINAHGFNVIHHEGLYYWYGSQKIPGLTESQKNEAGVSCYSSSDLMNWKNHGLVFSVSAENQHEDIAKAGILDRPKVFFHSVTKKFVMHFKLYPPHAAGGTKGTDVAYVGTATSPSPLGPFTYEGKYTGAGSPNGSGDFGIYQDHQGAFWHIAVRKPDKMLVCGKLRPDALRPEGPYTEMKGITAATEAPVLFRRKGRLYLLGSGSTGWAPNPARMFVADDITGPWTDLGNPTQGINPHNKLGPEKTFGGQSTFVMPYPGKDDEWIAMFDIWNPEQPVHAGYIWLPLRFDHDKPEIRWETEWKPVTGPLPEKHPSTSKARYLWLEAEDFTSFGSWIPVQENSALMGRTNGKSSQNQNRSARAAIHVESAGTYKVWVRAYDSKNTKIARDFRVSLNAVVSSRSVGTHGNDGWAWQDAGVFSLEKGEVAIELIDSSQYYARCDKLLLTTDMNYVPKGAGGDRNTHPLPPAHPRATHYVKATFNDLNAGALAAQFGGEGFVTTAPWTLHGDIPIRSGDLQMPASDGREFILSQSGTPAHLTSASEDLNQAIRRIATPMNGQLWFRFLVKPHDASGTAGIKLLPGTDLTQGHEIRCDGRDLSYRKPNDPNATISKNAFPLGKTSLVIGTCDIDPDRDGRRSLSLWVNPSVEQPGTPLIKIALSDSIQSITHLALVMSAGKKSSSSPMLDEVILSNHPYPAGFYHVCPRKQHFGQWHMPVKPSENSTPLPPPGYELVFSDEFDANTLDHSKWDYRLRDKPDSAQEAENVEVRDGHLLIHAKKQPVGKYNYTGGGIISKPLFVYGYYESRFKIPAAEGWHTAFWTMPAYEPLEARNTEIDFCEQDSGDPRYFSLGLINHREKGWNASNIGRWVVEDAPNMVDQFIVIAADFTPDSIRFYMNGRLTKEVDSRLFPHGPATVQLSCIASRKKGDRFQDDARLPSHATFDYVRVYQHPRHAAAEAAAKTKAVLPTLPLPPLSERQRAGAATGELD